MFWIKDIQTEVNLITNLSSTISLLIISGSISLFIIFVSLKLQLINACEK